MRHSDNGQGLRQQHLAKREAEARSRGYFGPWPPAPVVVESASEGEHWLARVEGGEHRASALTAISRGFVEFYRELTAEHFRRLGTVLIDVARDKRTADRVRLRAVEAVLRVLHNAARVLKKLPADEQSGKLTNHLWMLLTAFLDSIAKDDWQVLTNTLRELTETKVPSTRVRAAASMMNMIVNTSELAVLFQAPATRREQDERDAELMAAAEPRLRQLEAEADLEDCQPQFIGGDSNGDTDK